MSWTSDTTGRRFQSSNELWIHNTVSKIRCHEGVNVILLSGFSILYSRSDMRGSSSLVPSPITNRSSTHFQDDFIYDQCDHLALVTFVSRALQRTNHSIFLFYWLFHLCLMPKSDEGGRGRTENFTHGGGRGLSKICHMWRSISLVTLLFCVHLFCSQVTGGKIWGMGHVFVDSVMSYCELFISIPLNVNRVTQRL